MLKQENNVIQTAKSLLYDRALVKIKDQLVGAVAAIALQPEPDLNYTEVFIRDNVPVMIYLLLEGKSEIVRHFLEMCLELQSQDFPTTGIFPTSFTEINGEIKVDYGQRAIGRVCSVDASLWWSILAYIYVQWTGDEAWALSFKVQSGLEKFIDLILHPTFRDAPTLYVPDGAFMIDRPLDVWGNPLEIQVLLYGALKSAIYLMALPHKNHDETSTQEILGLQKIKTIKLGINWLKNLRTYLLKHYWLNGNIVQTLRKRPTEQYGEAVINEYNIQTETIPNWLQSWLQNQGGYLIGNIRTGRPDFRFFSLGNCLGAIFDVTSYAQQLAFFRFLITNQNELCAEMPLRICHPPLDENRWKYFTGYDRKNLPWSYHNSGHWPCLFWFLVVAVLRQKSTNSLEKNPPEMVEMEILLQNNYELLLYRLPKQKWAEYFDGPTGLWVGQQARTYQTWTIVSLLLVNHFLYSPHDSQIMSLPSLSFFQDLERQLS